VRNTRTSFKGSHDFHTRTKKVPLSRKEGALGRKAGTIDLALLYEEGTYYQQNKKKGIEYLIKTRSAPVNRTEDTPWVQGRHDRYEGRCRPQNEVKKPRIIDFFFGARAWKRLNEKTPKDSFSRLQPSLPSQRYATTKGYGPTYLAFFHVFRLRTESRTAMHLSKIQQPILPSKLGEITSSPGEVDEKPAGVHFTTTPATLEAAWLVYQNTWGQKHVGTCNLCSRLVLEFYYQ
jgi:hypothetical protein